MKQIRNLLFLSLFILTSQVAWGQHATRKVAAEVQEMLSKQDVAWNRGDLEGFMNAYWQNDSLKFIGKEGVVYGWNATLARYRKAYGTEKSSMGTLKTTNLHIDQLADDAAYVVGRWQLTWKKEGGKEEVKSGHYLLVLRKIEGRWYVVADHSS
jgi:uncharacterized protein (TIGR02246 family)